MELAACLGSAWRQGLTHVHTHVHVAFLPTSVEFLSSLYFDRYRLTGIWYSTCRQEADNQPPTGVV